MKIAILGTVVYDEIVTHRGERKQSFGGITYNVAALASLIDAGTELVPIAQVGYDRYDEAIELYRGWKGTRTEGLRRMPETKNPHVRLIYSSITARREHMLHVPPPLAPEQIEMAAGCDAILVNFITGRELDKAGFRTLGNKATGHFHLDVHNKITRWTDAGEREFVGLADWRDWLGVPTTVQMNEFEIEHVLGRPVKGTEGYVAAAAEVLSAGAQAVMITLGPQGSVIAYRDGDSVYATPWPAADLGTVIDTTGCGDSFSAGFLWWYLRTGDFLKANAAANIVGDVNCITPGIGNLDRAREMETLLPAAWPERVAKLDGGWKGETVSMTIT